MKITCQIILVFLFSLGLMYNLYRDYKRANIRHDASFSDVVVSLIIGITMLFLLWGAGGLSEIL